MILMPSIIENDGRSNRMFVLPSKLFEQNIILLENQIDDGLAAVVKMQLLYLDSKEECKEIFTRRRNCIC